MLAEDAREILEKQWRKESCNEIETEREFTYLDDWVVSIGGYKCGVTSRKIFGGLRSGNMASYYVERFSVRLTVFINKSYTRPELLYGIEVLYPIENLKIILGIEGSMVRLVCGV